MGWVSRLEAESHYTYLGLPEERYSIYYESITVGSFGCYSGAPSHMPEAATRRLFQDSLILRIGLLVGGIALLALASITASIVIAEATRGNAAAINLAGSLRMQSYRIATEVLATDSDEAAVQAEVAEFERRLHSSLLAQSLGGTQRKLGLVFAAISRQWFEELKPAALAAAGNGGDYLQRVDGFVARLDELVKGLEDATERNILLLRVVQGMALFITLFLVFIIMHQLNSNAVAPLRDLVEVAGRIRQGDFAVRAQHLGEDELGVLGRALNQAAEAVSGMYGELERQVELQTRALRDSHRALELLYNISRRLQANPLRDSDWQGLIAELETVWGLGGIALCLYRPGSRQPQRLYGSACGEPLLVLSIGEAEQPFGELRLYGGEAQDEGRGQVERRLLESVAEHIAVALRASRQQERDRRLALLEERQVIARELHDSLAQALSYLKIQVALLRNGLEQGEAEQQIARFAVALEQGLDSAYRQLRELLTTFRLKMDQPSLAAALSETAREFEARAEGLGIRLILAEDCPLSPNEEIHVLQIVREALANVVRHARARHAEVALELLEGGRMRLTVRDDGVGLPTDPPPRQYHHGLTIMGERARSLGGELRLEKAPEGGTRVTLEFTPKRYANREAGEE
ncbi:MAG TPA: ATP-binding protein [Candidatus Competibacteraceae bacterium]|nr:ATP-binding protein [Candidatus Competibacteraceae bacterium]